MKESSLGLHQIIVNGEHQFVVWPNDKRLPRGWRFVGREGTCEELGFYLQQMAVETVPAPLLRSHGSALDTQDGWLT